MQKLDNSLLMLSVLILVTGCTSGKGSPSQNAVPNPVISLKMTESMVPDSIGNMYFVDRQNHFVRKMDSDGNLSIYAGTGVAASVDGLKTDASFSYPGAIAIDSNDNIYVGDWSYDPSYLSVVRKIDPSGNVSTVATLPSGTNGYIYAMDVNSDDEVFMTTWSQLWKLTPNGTLTVFAGSATIGINDGVGASAEFDQPYALTIDDADTIWISMPRPTASWILRKVDTSANVTTVTPISGSYAMKYYEDHLYFLMDDNIIKYKISNGVFSHLADDVYLQASNGGHVLGIHPTYGFFIDKTEDEMAIVPWPTD